MLNLDLFNMVELGDSSSVSLDQNYILENYRDENSKPIEFIELNLNIVE